MTTEVFLISSKVKFIGAEGLSVVEHNETKKVKKVLMDSSTWLRRSLPLTKDVDVAGRSGDTVDVLHLDHEVSMVSSDSVTDHQGTLPPSGLI